MGNHCPLFFFNKSALSKQKLKNFQSKIDHQINFSNPTAQRMTIPQQNLHKIFQLVNNSNHLKESSSNYQMSTRKFTLFKNNTKNTIVDLNTMHTMNTNKNISVSIKQGFQQQSSNYMSQSKGNFIKFTQKEHHPFIEKILYVKKEKKKTEIITPSQKYTYKHYFQNIQTTLFLFQGITPQHCFSVDQKFLFLSQQSPIKIKLLLECLKCEISRIVTLSKALINLQKIYCDHCNISGIWNIESITSNFPLWGNGQKLNKDLLPIRAPVIIRAMGCTKCFKFENLLQNQCKCFICRNCYETDPICRLCENKQERQL